MKTAIVLSGGGAKGSYQIGVWKALRRLHIKYDIVTGTSIGSLNGALMVQNDYYKAYRLWTNLDYDTVLDAKITNTKDKVQIFKEYTKGVLDGGLSVTALEKTIAEHLNIRKFFKSKIDYALVTVEYPSLKPIIKTKNNLSLEKDKVKDYLMASASCFPAFKKKEINDKKYIDGGYYDNLPINPAIDLGAERVIAVNLDAPGNKRKIKKKVDVTYIEPKNDYGSFLQFDSNMAKRGIRLGYNDTMKTFSKLEGNIYTFKKKHLKKNYNKYNKKYYEILNAVVDTNSKDDPLLEKILSFALTKRLKNEDLEKHINMVMENTGKIMGIDDSYIYSYYVFNRLLRDKFSKIETKVYNKIKKEISLNHIKLLFNAPELVYYLYQVLSKNNLKDIYRLALMFPSEMLSAVYLKTIEKGEL